MPRCPGYGFQARDFKESNCDVFLLALNDDFRLEPLDSNKNLLYLVQGYHTSGRLSNRTGGFFRIFFVYSWGPALLDPNHLPEGVLVTAGGEEEGLEALQPLCALGNHSRPWPVGGPLSLWYNASAPGWGREGP